jgi:transcription elongation factor GreB
VGVDEADAERGWISWVSPIAKALLGKSAGETAVVTLPAGERELEIVDVGYEAPD